MCRSGARSRSMAVCRLCSRPPTLEPRLRYMVFMLPAQAAPPAPPSKQPGLVTVAVLWLHVEVFVSQFGGHAATRRAVQEPELDQVGLIHLFDGVRLLGNRGRDGVHAHRTATVL